jgi:hypothetical protein
VEFESSAEGLVGVAAAVPVFGLSAEGLVAGIAGRVDRFAEAGSSFVRMPVFAKLVLAVHIEG